MSLKQNLLDQIAELQSRVALLNAFPEDIYPLGTLVLFSGTRQNDTPFKLYLVKDGEESWVDKTNHEYLPLSEWLLKYKTSPNVKYFEAYLLHIEELPFYASA